jgi:ketosteroid isomerase-like protein
MPQEHLEAIRSVYERWKEGDFSAVDHLLDPLILFVMGEGLPETGSYLGTKALADYMRGFLEPWTRITIEAEEIEAAGDSVFAAVLQRGVGSGSGAATELRYCHVWTFRGDKVIRLETFRDRAAARAATGLSPESA